MQDGGLENTWLIDFGYSRHMIGSSKWFSSLNPVQCKEYITFGNNSKGKVLSYGTIRVNESFILKDVALVSNLHFNLLSVSQLRQDGFEVRFKTSLSRVLDTQILIRKRILEMRQQTCRRPLTLCDTPSSISPSAIRQGTLDDWTTDAAPA
jgi:hypothetical protein